MSAIRLKNVCKQWGATHAVQSVSFEVNEGSLLVLLGPSGCGKSTTLRLIAGLESVTDGRIYIGDRDVTDLPPAERHLAMLEGASRAYYYRRVVIPLLMPTTLFVLINATINAFRMVDHLFVLTQGGPNNATSLLLYYIYETSFKFWDTGYGATLTMVLLGFLGFAAFVQFGIIEKRVHYR